MLHWRRPKQHRYHAPRPHLQGGGRAIVALENAQDGAVEGIQNARRRHGASNCCVGGGNQEHNARCDDDNSRRAAIKGMATWCEATAAVRRQA